MWIEAEIHQVYLEKGRAKLIVFELDPSLLFDVTLVAPARYRFVMYPSQEGVVEYAVTAGPRPDAKIRLAERHGVALSVKAAEAVENRPAAGQKSTGDRGCLVHQQAAVELEAVARRIAHGFVASASVVIEDHPGMLERSVGVEQPPTDDSDLRSRQLAAQPNIPILG